MNPQGAQHYLRTRVLTATPERLQLMLYDGAIRFAEQGKAALARSDFEASHLSLTRAQKVIAELSGSRLNMTSRRNCAASSRGFTTLCIESWWKPTWSTR